MKLKKEFIKREIAGENLLVPTGETSLTFNGLITLNEVGAFIWDKLSQAQSEEDVVEFILEEYDVDEETAKADTKEFLGKLKSAEII